MLENWNIVDNLKDFVIKFRGLADGKHEYDYLLKKSFFDVIVEDDVHGGEVKLKVILTVEDRMLTFDFFFDGKINVMCDRCLDYFDIPFSLTEKLYVKFGKEEENEDFNLIYLPEEEFRIDLLDYLVQYVVTNLPMKRIHPNDANGNSLCNQAMIEKLKELDKSQEETAETDPRWDALKKIITK